MKTNEIKKVMIALDYNPTAQKVAEVGFALAKAMNAEVILLHVMAEPVYYSSTEYSPIMGFTGFLDITGMQLGNGVAIKKAALNFLEKSKNHLGDNTIQTIVTEGDFAESILKSAKKLKANIIVIGSHSRKWLEKIVMGSVAEEILNKSTIPMFIIPTKKHD
jgi:nucleotide-binding universal stress UspA family protein